MRAPSFKFRAFSRKQKQVVTWWREESPVADYDGIICDGAVRSGKTIAFIVGFVLWSTETFSGTNSGQNFILASKSMGALKRNVINPLCQILRALGIEFTYNRSEHWLEFGGNTYYCFGANNEASQDVVQGLTAAGCYLDEVALMPWSFIDQAIARCSVEDAKFWFNCNPESPYHEVKLELIDKAEQKRLVHLHFDMADNLTLSPRARERYARMFFGVWYKRKVLGLWVAAEGAIYDILDESEHVVDALPALPNGAQYRYFVGSDYGTGTVTTFWLAAIHPDGTIYLIDRLRWDTAQKQRQKSDLQFAEDLHGWLDGHGVTPEFIVVPSDAQSFIVQLQQMRGSQKYLRFRRVMVDPREPGSVVDGIRDVYTLLARRSLFFLRSVVNDGGMVEMSGYVWDPKAQERGEDAPLKQHDHDPDAIRYLVRATRNIWARALRIDMKRAA